MHNFKIGNHISAFMVVLSPIRAYYVAKHELKLWHCLLYFVS